MHIKHEKLSDGRIAISQSDFEDLLDVLAYDEAPVSSTEVRALIAKHAPTLPVPPKIADYIGRHHLYQDTE